MPMDVVHKAVGFLDIFFFFKLVIIYKTFNESPSHSFVSRSRFSAKFEGISSIPSFSQAICQSFLHWQANTSALLSAAEAEDKQPGGGWDNSVRWGSSGKIFIYLNCF